MAAPEQGETHGKEWQAEQPVHYVRRHWHLELTVLASWNEGAAKSAIVDFVARVTEGGGGGLCPAGGADRHVRQRRHPVVRAAGTGAGVLPDRSGEAARGEGPVAEAAPAVQGAPRG